MWVDIEGAQSVRTVALDLVVIDGEGPGEAMPALCLFKPESMVDGALKDGEGPRADTETSSIHMSTQIL